MTHPRYINLHDRAVLKVSGADASTFLQGLLSNDVRKLDSGEAIYALMLTPQGKFLFECFAIKQGEDILLETAKDRAELFLKKLSMYKLRSLVSIENVSAEYQVVALLDKPFSGHICFTDPRYAALGWRALLKPGTMLDGFEEASLSEYHHYRISLGVPDAVEDMVPEEDFPLFYGMDKFNAVDYEKGCYVGQEVTARTHWRGTMRKALYKVRAESELPTKGTLVKQDGKTIGELASHSGNIGLALLEIEAVERSRQAQAEDVILDIE